MPSVTDAEGHGCPATPAESGDLGWFPGEFYACATARTDALFELTDAILCDDGPVRSLPELSLVAEHRRGHGAMYDALACGQIEPRRLRRARRPRHRQGDRPGQAPVAARQRRGQHPRRGVGTPSCGLIRGFVDGHRRGSFEGSLRQRHGRGRSLTPDRITPPGAHPSREFGWGTVVGLVEPVPV